MDEDKYCGEREIRKGGGRYMAIYKVMVQLGLIEKLTFSQI